MQTSAADCFVYTKLYFEITSFVFWATVWTFHHSTLLNVRASLLTFLFSNKLHSYTEYSDITSDKKNSKMITWILCVKHKLKKLILWMPCICKLLLCCILQQNQMLVFFNDNQGYQACVQKSGQMPFKTRPKRAQCSDAEDARDCFSTYACVLGLITGMWLFDLM